MACEIRNYYKDPCGTYRIWVRSNGTARLTCSSLSGTRWYNKLYKTERGAKIALGRLCGGLPTLYNSIKLENKLLKRK